MKTRRTTAVASKYSNSQSAISIDRHNSRSPERPSFIRDIKIPDIHYADDQAIDADTKIKQQLESIDGYFSIIFTKQPIEMAMSASDVSQHQRLVRNAGGGTGIGGNKQQEINVDQTRFEGIREMIQEQLNAKFNQFNKYNPDEINSAAKEFTIQVEKQLSCLKPFGFKCICNTFVYEVKPKMSFASKNLLLLDNSTDFVFTLNYTNRRVYVDCVVLLLKHHSV